MKKLPLASAGETQSSVLDSLPSFQSGPTAPPQASGIEMPAPAKNSGTQPLMMILPKQGRNQVRVHVSNDTKHDTTTRNQGATASRRYRQRQKEAIGKVSRLEVEIQEGAEEAKRKFSQLEALLHQRGEETNSRISRLEAETQRCQRMICSLSNQNTQFQLCMS